MKRIFITFSIIYLLSVTIFGQVNESTLSIEEKQEAQNLAANFFNRYQQTQDIKPLIKEFFVKDFSTRLKYCWTTDECGGFAKDFWHKQEELTSHKATELDFLRFYIVLTNDFFLYFNILKHLQPDSKQISDNSYKIGEQLITKRLKVLLKHNPKAIRIGLIYEPDLPFNFTSLNQFQQWLSNYELHNSALKTVESRLRQVLHKRNHKSKNLSSPKDFRIDIEENKNQFFNYPVGTKMFDVWTETNSILFKMDLIKVNNKLKIVAVYIPMD